MELKNLQLKMALVRPRNLGLLSWLLVHLMQHIMTTPLPKRTFMNETLANIKFALVIGESGMFFLKGLNLEALTVEDVDSSDPAEVIYMYKGLKKAPSRGPVPNRTTLAESILNHEFPWGSTMSWTMIKVALENQPSRFIRGWMMDPSWDLDSQGQAARLFIIFTRDVWLAIGEQFASLELLPDPTSLNEAMKAWSVESVNTLLQDKVTFMASPYGLIGAPPAIYKREVSFSKRRGMYFPPKDTIIDERSAWGGLKRVKGAYLHSYHLFIAASNPEGVADCHRTLDTIFSHLQSLPNWEIKSTAKQYTGPIWTSTSHKVIMVTNPEYYKVKGIRQEDRQHQQPTRPQASAKVVEARLELEHNGRIISGRRCQNKKPAPRRSAKHKAAQKPSGKDKKEAKEASEESDESWSDDEGFEASSEGGHSS